MELRVDPRLFHEFHFKIAMSLNLPITTQRLIEEFVDIDVNTSAVVKIVQRNQYFERMLVEEMKSMGLKDAPTLAAAIPLLGMQKVRNFICALQILRMVGRRHPTLSKEGKFSFTPAEFLPYAIRTEEYITNYKMPYSDTAYAAGMMFDLMASVGKELFDAAKTYETYVNDVYIHGLKTARIAVEIAKSFKNFGFSKYIFSASLIHDIGKLAMFLLFPGGNGTESFAAFVEDMPKRNLAREVIHFIEAKRFGLTHEYYSAQLGYDFRIFQSVEKAILFHHDPYVIRTENKELYNLASLIALASNMANYFKPAKDPFDPIFKQWFTPELKDFKVDPKYLVQIMAKITRELF